MTVFENFKTKNINELAEWFNEYIRYDGSPWCNWWDKNYCNNCIAEIVSDEDGYEKDYAWCELNDKCRFFKDMDDIPDIKQTIKMWLESEC